MSAAASVETLTAEQRVELEARCAWYEERGKAEHDATFSVAAVRALLLELAQLRQDADRLDWVQDQIHGTGKALAVGGSCYWSASVGRKRVGEGEHLRGALDNWMRNARPVAAAAPQGGAS